MDFFCSPSRSSSSDFTRWVRSSFFFSSSSTLEATFPPPQPHRRSAIRENTAICLMGRLPVLCGHCRTLLWLRGFHALLHADLCDEADQPALFFASAQVSLAKLLDM